MKTWALFLMSFAAMTETACTTTYSDISSGVDSLYDIDCSHSFMNEIENCKAMARTLCPKGYQTLAHHRSEGFVTIQKTITVKCNSK